MGGRWSRLGAFGGIAGAAATLAMGACTGKSGHAEDGDPKSARASGGTSSSGPDGGMNADDGTNAPTGGVTATGGGPGADGGPGGSAGSGGVPDECQGIRTNAPCAVEGTLCENLPCGPDNVGRRQCACAAQTWSCAACNWYDRRPDPPLPACSSDVADAVACGTQNSVCGPVGEEYCVCYPDAELGLVWTCEVPPGPWEP